MATFTANVQGVYIVPIPLSANLTNITLTGALDGQQVILEFQQNATGGWTVASSSITGLQQPVVTPNVNSFQVFIYNLGLSEWQEISGGGGGGGGVTSLNTLTGALVLTPTTGISITPSGLDIGIGNTGVTSITVSGSLTASGSTGAIALASTQNVPWIDVQTYGAIPKPNANRNDSTTAITSGGLPNITLASPLTYLVNGAGICIWEVGAATSQSTPSAPSVTSPAVSGSQTLTYKCVGYDASGGLTQASAAGTVTTAPAVFGPQPVTISSITATGGTVTANFSAPLNNTVSAGMTLHISGVTGSGATWNGVWTVATAPTTSQVTFAVSGATGTGTVSSSSKGRLSNSQQITAISRSSSGVITITTAENHNWIAQVNTHTPTIVIIENCTPLDLNGYYVVATASSNTLTCNTGNYSAETGAIVTGSSIATVWEYAVVACPVLSGTTVGYYVYSDSPNPGSPLTLIGKVLQGERHFTDWGPFYASGYIAPGYVPTSPPSSPQNKIFFSTIISGGGTTNLVLKDNVPTGLSGAVVLYDDGPCVIAAGNAAKTIGGFAFLSPPTTSITSPLYIFNSPQTYPSSTGLQVGAGVYINETWTGFANCQINSPYGSAYSLTPPFSRRSYPLWFGLGNPMIFGNGQSGNGINIDGLLFNDYFTNGQRFIILFGSAYGTISNCAFDANQFGTCVPLVFSGNCSSMEISNTAFVGNSIMGQLPVPGQGVLGPPTVPLCLFFASDNPTEDGYPTTQVLFSGINNFYGRGIFVDGTNFTNASSQNWEFGEIFWNQAPTAPTIAFTGPAYNGISITGVIMDSLPPPVLGAWCPQMIGVSINYCATDGEFQPLITGLPIQSLTVVGAGEGGNSNGQNVATVQDWFGTTNILAISTSPPRGSVTYQGKPLNIGVAATLFAGGQNTSTVGATASGAGTFSAATHTVGVTFVGWDGGETAPQNTTVATNGSQGIAVTWTAVSGFQGANVYIDSFRQNASVYTGTSHTFTSPSNIAAGATIDCTGLPCIAPGLIITPELVFPQGLFTLTCSPPTLSANRTMNYGDGANSSIVSASLTTTGAGSPYTVTLQGMTSSSHIAITPTNAAAGLDWASGNVYVGTKSANSVVINTGVTSGETFDILATVN